MCKRLQGKSPSYLPTLEQHLLWSKGSRLSCCPGNQRLLAGLVLELAATYSTLGTSQVLSHQIVRSTVQGANFTSQCGASQHWKESGVTQVSGLRLAPQSSGSTLGTASSHDGQSAQNDPERTWTRLLSTWHFQHCARQLQSTFQHFTCLRSKISILYNVNETWCCKDDIYEWSQ